MIFLLWLSIVLTLGTQNAREMGGEYCDTETFRAECGDNEVIVMLKASYGRMKLGRCIEMGLGHLGCYKNVLHILDRRCSGKRVCEIRIPDAELESTRPCLKELKTYLDATFSCQSVESFITAECPMWNFTLTSSVTFIYLSNVNFFHSLSMLLGSHTSCLTTPANQLRTKSTPQSSPNLFAPTHLFQPSEATPTLHPPPPISPPIYVSATPGQIINVTLVDFAYYKTPSNISSKKLKLPHSYFQNKGHRESQGRVIMRPRRQGLNSTNQHQPCRKYAYLLDIVTGVAKDILVCQQRISNVFVSKGHQVKLVMDTYDLQLADGEPRDRFILKFEALGCAKPHYPEELGWFKRKSPYLGIMGCHFLELTWSVTCNYSHWLGVDRACPLATTTTPPSTTTTQRRTHPLSMFHPTLTPPIQLGISSGKNNSGQRFYEYYVEDASNKFDDVITDGDQRASFDLVASVILIIATSILVLLIIFAIKRLKTRNEGTMEDSPSSGKMADHCHVVSTCHGSHVLLTNYDNKETFCCGVVAGGGGTNQLLPTPHQQNNHKTSTSTTTTPTATTTLKDGQQTLISSCNNINNHHHHHHHNHSSSNRINHL